MKWEKKGKGISLVLIVVFILGLLGSQILADEKVEVTKLERVQWAGIELFGIRILGHWRPVRARYTFWGAYYTSPSPYFRLNEDNQTIFRGLGRESDFAQALFPTLSPRENIQNLFKPVDKAGESLEKFDEQRSTGEAIYMTGNFLYDGGQIAFWSGAIASIASAAMGSEYRSRFYSNVTTVGAIAIILGLMGKFYGGQLAQEALGHLDDATEYFNEAHGKISSHSSSLSLTMKEESSKLILCIGFTF